MVSFAALIQMGFKVAFNCRYRVCCVKLIVRTYLLGDWTFGMTLGFVGAMSSKWYNQLNKLGASNIQEVTMQTCEM